MGPNASNVVHRRERIEINVKQLPLLDTGELPDP
jgi:hypothetical protein